MRYINPEWRHSDTPPRIGSAETRRANTAYRDVVVHDARVADVDFGIDTSGFTLLEHPTAVACADEERLRSEYRQQMLELVQSESGADHIFMLGHLVRTEDQSDFNTAYARFAHCDYNEKANGFMSRNLLAKRGVTPEPGWTFVWYNTWQPFDNVVQQNALAMLDVRSLGNDLIDYSYTGYDEEEGGLVAAPVYSPDHQWFYYPDMTTDEVLFTKQLDPRPGRVSQCPHTSFFDKSQPPDVPPRRSVECRILAVFENS